MASLKNNDIAMLNGLSKRSNNKTLLPPPPANLNPNKTSQSQPNKENLSGKVKEYEDAVRKIRDATGVSDANEIIQKFSTHSDTLKSLEIQKQKNEKKLMELQENLKKAQADLEKARFEGVDSVSIKKQAEDLEKNLALAQVKYDRNSEKVEKMRKVLVNAKAGVEHLCEKLADIKIPGSANIIVIDDTMVEALV